MRQVLAFAIVACVVSAGYAGWYWLERRADWVAERRRPVVLPALSDTARAGARLFGVHCAACHGDDAGGTATGPTLIDSIYRPAHHADVSFALALRHGVRAHHWRFGNMPPVPGLNADEVASIVRYVREVQQANGVK